MVVDSPHRFSNALVNLIVQFGPASARILRLHSAALVGGYGEWLLKFGEAQRGSLLAPRPKILYQIQFSSAQEIPGSPISSRKESVGVRICFNIISSCYCIAITAK